LQLSSPVEEATLDTLFDPLAPTENLALFTGVEVSQAMLTVSAKDADVELGVSASLDIAPLCSVDAMSPQAQYVTELAVAIVAADEVKGDEEKSELVQPTCTITLRVTYKPSAKDQREELYDLLNKASQKKVKAIDKLRRCATAVSRATPPSTNVTKPTMKPGFLNKQKKGKSKWKLWYDRTLGPQSFVRQVMPIAKNYVIFFGVMALFHFKGQELALPAPV
jgi:hypothetical protein